jgi:hypothetical protein
MSNVDVRISVYGCIGEVPTSTKAGLTEPMPSNRGSIMTTPHFHSSACASRGDGGVFSNGSKKVARAAEPAAAADDDDDDDDHDDSEGDAFSLRALLLLLLLLVDIDELEGTTSVTS